MIILKYLIGVVILTLLVSFGIQTLRLNDARATIASLDRDKQTASEESILNAAQAGVDVLNENLERKNEDEPATVRVVERIRDVCLQSATGASRVPVQAAPAGPGLPDAKAEDDREREIFISDLQDDINTCSVALRDCDSIRDYHNAQVHTGK